MAPPPSGLAPADRTFPQSAEEPVFTFSTTKMLKLGPAAAVPTQEHGPALVSQFGGGRGQPATDPSTEAQPMASAHQANFAAAHRTRPGVLTGSGVAESPASPTRPGQAAQRGDSAALPGAAAAAEQQRGSGPEQQAAAVSAAAQLAGPETTPTGVSQELACLPAGRGLEEQAGFAQQSVPSPNGSDSPARVQGQQSGPLPSGSDSPAGVHGQQSGPLPSGSASLAGLQGQGVPASFSAAAPAASTVFGQGSARVSFKTFSDVASFSVLHVMQALERFCTQGWPNPVMLNATIPDEVQQVCPGHS